MVVPNAVSFPPLLAIFPVCLMRQAVAFANVDGVFRHAPDMPLTCHRAALIRA